MNAVLFTIYDTTAEQFALTKAAFESIQAQDIPVKVYVLNNGSTWSETLVWIEQIRQNNNVFMFRSESVNKSPIFLANRYLWYLFVENEDWDDYHHVLCVPNDVVLPPNLYREFLRFPRGIVTGSMTDGSLGIIDRATAVNECTPLAVCLIRKWAHDALVAKDGYFFDPKFFMYASDCDFALRLAACGIRGVQLDIQYWHYGSASHRLGKHGEGAYGADADRDYFRSKWGFAVDDPQYGEKARDINFLG